MTKLAVLGSSEGNGHPFSFAAIVNGYDSVRLRAAGWGAIADYLDLRDAVDFGISGARVTHAWCPDPDETHALAKATHISHIVEEPAELLGAVDGVLLARDDWQTHWSFAEPFLEANLPVFIDKPLTLDLEELEEFRPHLAAGRLMSCSGFRFAPELASLRAATASTPLATLQGAGPREWDRYGVHLVEPLLQVAAGTPRRVIPLRAGHDAVAIEQRDGPLLSVHCLGDRAPGFVVQAVTVGTARTLALQDRFTAFRRLLGHFVEMVRSGDPPIPPESTVQVMQVLAAGRRALRTTEPVELESV